MKEQKSQRGTNVFSGIGRLAVRVLLWLLLFLGWSATKVGKPLFDGGADLETWARERLER